MDFFTYQFRYEQRGKNRHQGNIERDRDEHSHSETESVENTRKLSTVLGNRNAISVFTHDYYGERAIMIFTQDKLRSVDMTTTNTHYTLHTFWAGLSSKALIKMKPNSP